MNNLTLIGGAATKLTMTSLEIAELTGKEHDNVRRDVKKLAEELGCGFVSLTIFARFTFPVIDANVVTNQNFGIVG